MRLPVPTYAFEIIHADLVGPLPETKSGNVYLLVVVDRLTRYAEIFALPNKQSHTVAAVMVAEVYTRHNHIRCLITDQGGEFQSMLFREISKLFGIKQLRTTAYHPQCNGMVERLNRTIVDILAKKCREREDGNVQWDTYLPYVRRAYNSSPQRTVSRSPHFLLYGEDPDLPPTIANLFWEPETNWSEAYRIDIMRRTILEARIDALEISEAGFEYDRDRHNEPVDPFTYFVGDKVYLDISKMKPPKKLYPKREPPHNRKFRPKWYGPYDVIEVRDNNVLVLLLPGQPSHKAKAIGTSRVKPCPTG